MYTENGPTIKDGNKLRPHFVYYFSRNIIWEKMML